jgi:hypothetical protein
MEKGNQTKDHHSIIFCFTPMAFQVFEQENLHDFEIVYFGVSFLPKETNSKCIPEGCLIAKTFSPSKALVKINVEYICSMLKY